MELAAEHKHMDVLKWCAENGAPMPSRLPSWAPMP